MEDLKQALSVLPGTFAICRLESDAKILNWMYSSSFFSITRTLEELSIICSQENIPALVICSKGWRCMKIEGPFAPSSIGVLASITTPLALADIGLFVSSTYDTDYILVQEKDLDRAVLTLSEGKHQIIFSE